MAGLYLALLDAGFSAEYLDECSYHDLDLFSEELHELRKKQKSANR